MQRFGGYLLLIASLALFVLAIQQLDGETVAVSVEPILLPTRDAVVTPVNIATSVPELETADVTVGLAIVPDTALVPVLNPLTYQPKLPDHQFEIYQVERGDTPNIIADRFDISAATLLGGNPWLSQESNALQSGTELLILPINGALHTVKPGDTLENIAEQYDVPVADILNYPSNNLEFPYRLQPDTQLLIPGATVGVFYWTAPKTVVGSNGQWAVIGSGFFDWPTGGRCITQYSWYGHPAIDVSLGEGSGLYAADHGTVTYAAWAAGSYYDYGNLIVINHGNGYETLYAHLNSIGVYAGQTVQKGEWIGNSGNTGRSSGPHLHFEIRLNDIRTNPLDYLIGSVTDCT